MYFRNAGTLMPLYRTDNTRTSLQPFHISVTTMDNERAARTGVADYFTVVGVGDELVWKHSQKQQQQQLQTSDDLPNDADTQTADERERFWREIVDISIVCRDVSSSSVDQTMDDSCSKSSMTQQRQHPSQTDLSLIRQTDSLFSESSTSGAENSYGTGGLNSASFEKTPLTSGGSLLDSTSQQHDLPLSPSVSDATTTTTNAIPPNSRFAAASADPRTSNVGGWHIVSKTNPSSVPVLGPIHQPEDRSATADPSDSATVATNESLATPLLLWKHQTVWDANLDWSQGLRSQVHSRQEQVLSSVAMQHRKRGLRQKVADSIKQQFHHRLAVIRRHDDDDDDNMSDIHHFYLGFQRRFDSKAADSASRPAVAQVQLFYVQLDLNHLVAASSSTPSTSSKTKRTGFLTGQFLERYSASSNQQQEAIESVTSDGNDDDTSNLVNLADYLDLPDGFEEWSIPTEYLQIRDPKLVQRRQHGHSVTSSSTHHTTTTVLLQEEIDNRATSPRTAVGIEAVDSTMDNISINKNTAAHGPATLMPKLLSTPKGGHDPDEEQYFRYIPVLAIRRQRLGDEELYHEDSAVTDLAVSFVNGNDGQPILPIDEDDDDGEHDEDSFRVLGQTKWMSSWKNAGDSYDNTSAFGLPVVLVRRNAPYGFADVAFATRVLGRFPYKNYKGLPLPEEELPMFCYPTGCRLYRARLSEAPVAQYYGFVVKNERGDSIYVSCVSFMEPLTPDKVAQLATMSRKRAATSLAHRRFVEEQKRRGNASDCGTVATEADSLLMSFDEMTTFENKTICLVSRFPFWTAFRKYLLNIHVLSGISTEVPLERFISHLLLSVPLPRPGGPNILVPLSALSEPMVLALPPEKDFPLVDLPYQHLFACLEIKTVVMIVLSLLALERKVILLSSRPSLVLDVCELLRSLLFPFDLCAPYVPRLTEPFKSSLDFPGAIFVGIHDDGLETGLATMVKQTNPEDSIIVDLDTGEVACYGDRYEIMNRAWNILPEAPRTTLVSELETLCRDAGIVDGQEPLDSQYDASFDVALPSAIDDTGISAGGTAEPFDDRGARDAFLRFFCAILGGYERFLLVPDADFLVSGNEWFDSKGYLASVPQQHQRYLEALVSTQLFQSFIQRRTEASDVHCLLFDESLAEFHKTAVPYGRLGGDVNITSKVENERPQLMYSLLVDQSATLHGDSATIIGTIKSFDTDADSGHPKVSLSDILESEHAESTLNPDGDLVTLPTRKHLPRGKRFSHCVNGQPCFPHAFQRALFLPAEPESWIIKQSKNTNPLLARGERELEEANRRRRMATTQRGYQAQIRCLWQLPKLMGSHVLGAWLLCIPAQVSQARLTNDQQSRYLLRALGALRLLRTKQKIFPDEASYRALMVACGRAKSDRRVELVKAFGFLHADAIFPSAVTLGQYTKALAEGYSKRSTGVDKDDDLGGLEVTESTSRVGMYNIAGLNQRAGTDIESCLNSLNPNMATLEEQGRRWRQRGTVLDDGDKRKKPGTRPWLPVSFSSSFVPSSSMPHKSNETVRFAALWSRTRGCSGCSYIPLEEEIQAGWDILGGDYEIPGSVPCPRCGTLILPMLGIREFSLTQALQLKPGVASQNLADFDELPPQICPTIVAPDPSEDVTYVAYVSPSTVRLTLEQYVEEHGEEILERDRLKAHDPEVFYNFWWYCARFSLPLPLPISVEQRSESPLDIHHYCAMVAWDKLIAEKGCQSAAQVLAPLFEAEVKNHSNQDIPAMHGDLAPYEDTHLLSRFDLQSLYTNVWEHPQLSEALKVLCEATDTRDFKPVVDVIVRGNVHRHEQFEGSVNTSFVASDFHQDETNPTSSDISAALSPTVELEIYRTVLYLAKYQCTSMFHAFFPASTKAHCKGYHSWCSNRIPLPMFDRLLRDGAQRYKNSHKDTVGTNLVKSPSEVALGFRCVFGHLI